MKTCIFTIEQNERGFYVSINGEKSEDCEVFQAHYCKLALFFAKEEYAEFCANNEDYF